MPQQLDVIQKLTAHRGKVWSVNWHPSGIKSFNLHPNKPKNNKFKFLKIRKNLWKLWRG